MRASKGICNCLYAYLFYSTSIKCYWLSGACQWYII